MSFGNSENRLTFGSLFSGIGGFDLGLERAGLRCAWQVEIDEACRGVLSRHWPEVERYADVRECGRDNLRPVDVICGGFPCQDLSVAGKRAGLAGERSGLWFEFHRVIDELHPRWVVIENVPGLLSGCGCTACQAVGRIIRIHAWLRRRQGGIECPICIAGKRMLKSHSGRNFAVILRGLVELGYGVAWRVLDAQYFGVAQRRRRVFLVASFGNGNASQILFESEGSAWDTPPRREAGQGVAGSITERFAGGSNQWAPMNEADNLQVAEPFTFDWQAGVAENDRAWLWDKPGRTRSLSASRTLSVVQHALSGHNQRNDPDGEHFVVTGTLTAPDPNAPPRNGKRQDGSRQDRIPIVFQQNQRNEVRDLGDAAGALPSQPGMKQQNYIIPPLRSNGGVTSQPTLNKNLTDLDFLVNRTAGVRRLTPTECERLQGFPDGHTDGQADSTRYRQLGNAVAVPCAAWLGERLSAIDALPEPLDTLSER